MGSWSKFSGWSRKQSSRVTERGNSRDTARARHRGLTALIHTQTGNLQRPLHGPCSQKHLLHHYHRQRCLQGEQKGYNKGQEGRLRQDSDETSPDSSLTSERADTSGTTIARLDAERFQFRPDQLQRHEEFQKDAAYSMLLEG